MPAGDQRTDVIAQIVAKASKDQAFRKDLIANPTATLERELSARSGRKVKLPADIEVEVLEETPRKHYLVLPSVAAEAHTHELSEEDLAKVAGGWKYCWDTDPLCYDTQDCIFFTL